MFPIMKNAVFVRFENIGDKFDKNDETLIVDVYNFALALYRKANGNDAEVNSVNINEFDLTGN